MFLLFRLSYLDRSVAFTVLPIAIFLSHFLVFLLLPIFACRFLFPYLCRFLFFYLFLDTCCSSLTSLCLFFFMFSSYRIPLPPSTNFFSCFPFSCFLRVVPLFLIPLFSCLQYCSFCRLVSVFSLSRVLSSLFFSSYVFPSSCFFFASLLLTSLSLVIFSSVPYFLSLYFLSLSITLALSFFLFLVISS